MTFGEKVREARLKCGLRQCDLAASIGVTMRTIVSYEKGSCYPRKYETYLKLAEVLHVDVNYLRTENEVFISDVEEKYGLRGKKQAQELVAEVSGMFAGGDLDDEDLDSVMKALTDAYWIAKERNRKYAPRRQRASAGE